MLSRWIKQYLCDLPKQKHFFAKDYHCLIKLQLHLHVKLNMFVLFQVIAQQVTEENLREGRLYPPLVTIQDVSLKIAVRVRHFSLLGLFLSIFVFPPALHSLILSPNTPSHKLVYVNQYWTHSSFKIKF